METPDGAAENQSIARNKLVAIVLGSLCLLRSTNTIARGAEVLAKKAEFQSSKAREADDRQAAHAIPGHVWVGGRDVVTLTPNPAARELLLDLFSYCNHVPSVVNKTDSLAELNGIREAFTHACTYVVRNHASVEPNRVDDRVVRYAYEAVWCGGARTAYAVGVAYLEARFPQIRVGGAMRDSDGNIEPAPMLSDKEAEAQTKRMILRTYLNGLEDLPDKLDRSRTADLEATFEMGRPYVI